MKKEDYSQFERKGTLPVAEERRKHYKGKKTKVQELATPNERFVGIRGVDC